MAKEKPQKKSVHSGSTGFHVEEMYGVDIQGMKISGFEHGMVIGKASKTKMTNVDIVSAKAIEIQAELKKALDSVSAPEALKSEISTQVDSISKSSTKAEASGKYTSLIASLANHATVLTAVAPVLARLAEQIAS